MTLDYGVRKDILRSEVNAWISYIFIGVFALGAVFVIWNVAFGDNPLANAIVAASSASAAGSY